MTIEELEILVDEAYVLCRRLAAIQGPPRIIETQHLAMRRLRRRMDRLYDAQRAAVKGEAATG